MVHKLLLLLINIIIFISLVNAAGTNPNVDPTEYICYNLVEGQLNCNHAYCQSCFDENLNSAPKHKCKGLTCEVYEDGETEDEEDLILTINSPIKDYTYRSRYVLLDLFSEESLDSLYYGKSESRLTRIGRNIKSYKKTKSFRDGKNTLFIKAENNNIIFKDRIEFFIDSKKPRFRSSNSLRVTKGNFTIKIVEDNIESLKIYYGEDNNEIDISQCNKGRSYYTCNIFVELEDYDGEEIEYYFEVIDIADNKATSRVRKVLVDTKEPILSSYEASKKRNRATIILNIEEENLDKVTYEYRDRQRTFCTRLRKGVCKKTISTTEENINIIIKDDAGNIKLEKINLTGGNK